jgi:hypothetical protein
MPVTFARPSTLGKHPLVPSPSREIPVSAGRVVVPCGVASFFRVLAPYLQIAPAPWATRVLDTQDPRQC